MASADEFFGQGHNRRDGAARVVAHKEEALLRHCDPPRRHISMLQTCTVARLWARGGGIARVSVYKVIELIGTSDKSWEDAAVSAVKLARKSLRGLRVAEVVEQDLDLGDGKSVTYRVKLRVSFKYEGGE